MPTVLKRILVVVIFVICVAVVMWAEVQGNPHLLALGADSSVNMEGKESRFGVLVSSLFAVVTTAASCGAVIAMHDSFTALGGMVPMWLMQSASFLSLASIPSSSIT